MAYTLWSRGRLLGETDLGFRYRENGFRCGWLHPTDLGIRLLPFATGVAPAMRMMRTLGADETARADCLAAFDQEQALALELRGPDGATIPTEDIAVVDTHYLLSIPPDDAPETNDVLYCSDSEIEEMMEEWDEDGIDLGVSDPLLQDESEHPQYQLQVRLVDAISVP
jgi:hypothetical protein